MKQTFITFLAGITFFLPPLFTLAQGPLAPGLGSAACYAIFSSNGAVSNVGITHVTGDIGTNLGGATGFAPASVNGTIHPIPDASTVLAAADLLIAYNFLDALPYNEQLADPAQFGNNMVLTPKTYLLNAATTLTGNLYLDAGGNNNAIFVIRVEGALSAVNFSKVILLNGARSNNIFWQVEGAASINASAEFHGTIIANNAAITLASGSSLYGRAFTTTGAITVTENTTISPYVNCSSLTITGIVHNDANGLTEMGGGEVDGTGTNAGGIKAVLVDNLGNVVAFTNVAANGTFTFNRVIDGSYTILITTNMASPGYPAPAVILPAGWVNTGEYLGIGIGNDAVADGKLAVTVSGVNVSNAQFGIQQPPTAGGGTNITNNTGGTTMVVVPANTFTNGDGVTPNPSTDVAPGHVTSIRITDFPAGVSRMVIGGTGYNLDGSGGNTAWPVAGVVVPTDADGNPTIVISVDPASTQSTSITIQFVAIDNAGFESLNTGTAVLNLAGVPDLTPSILLPSNTFGENETKNVILNITELFNNPTVPGTATFSINVPTGYALEAYDNTLTSMVPSGGTSTLVNNTEISEISREGNIIQFRLNSGVSVAAQSFKSIGVRVTRTTANAGSTSGLVIGVIFDPTASTYDRNPLNNTFSRILNAQNPL